MHLLDANKAWGVRCNNPHAIGSATAVVGDVTCIACKQAPRRSRYGRQIVRDDSTRVPPGPAGGD